MFKRFILPVGQGAFYVEKFENKKNIIYDCGSMHNKNKIPNLIENCFKKNEIIEAIFISHLDEDHMNGVEELLKKCEVKRICFPLITEEMKLILKIKIMIEEAIGSSYSEFVKEFIENPEEAIKKIIEKKKIELIEILPMGEENKKEIDKEIIKNNKIKRIEKKSGEDIAQEIKGLEYNGNKWELIPYNFKQETRINEFKKNLKKEFKDEISLEKVEEIWKNNKDSSKEKIKKAYKNIKGSLNTNSMTLFSGIIQDEKSYYNTSISNYIYIKVGCLYTGDYEAKGKNKWETLEKAYQNYWKWIGFIQVPHHGSSHNCNDNLINKNAIYFISVGEKNRYKHPSPEVVHDITFKYSNNLYIVKEDKGVVIIFNNYMGIYNIFSSFNKTLETELKKFYFYLCV
ncbi:MBL fold metallo-hydrolase [Fusobacterium polymorphum]|uniref:MBL fold metallo-hydrolase n=1 Tax=Fusobacterium nucleatum subsp. polymorphum TaxID=76857 RepID=UPI0030CCB139